MFVAQCTRLAAVLLALPAAACDAPEPDTPHYSVTVLDSAGVRIVENAGVRWSAANQWRLTGEPVLRIGGIAGAGAEINLVSDLTLLEDGTIVVAQGRELTFIGADGRLVASFERPGAGPGEFGFIQAVRPYPGGLVAVYTAALARVLLFDAGGRHLRDIQLQPLIPRPALEGVLPDGQLLFSYIDSDSAFYVLHGSDGAAGDTIARLRGRDTYESTADGWPRTAVAPFGRAPHVAVVAEHVYVGHGDSYAIRVHTVSGELVGMIRNVKPARPLSRADVARYRQILADAGGNPARRPQIERLLDEVAWPDYAAALTDLHADPLGNLWVCEGDALHTGGSCWTVYDADGAVLGAVDMPADVAVKHIGTDRLLGLRFDTLGVPELVVYGLDRSSDGTASH
jgi:hypothetical protein